jgi:hypothetical protein
MDPHVLEALVNLVRLRHRLAGDNVELDQLLREVQREAICKIIRFQPNLNGSL